MYGQGRQETVEAFGRTLRRLRRERDLSQEALSHLSGLSAKHLSDIERGRSEPRLTTVVQLADALAVDVGELFR